MDNQADQVAGVADEAADAASQPDKTVRKSSAAGADPDKKSQDASEVGPNATADEAGAATAKTRATVTAPRSSRASSTATAAVQAKNGTGSASDSPSESEAPSGLGSSSVPGSSSADDTADQRDSPAVTMAQGGKRTDATIPRAAMPPPDESLSKGNGHPEMPAKPLGASAPDPVVASGKTKSASAGPASSESAGLESATSASARPGFASSASPEPDILSKAKTPSAPAKPATPSAAETNPSWRSPASFASTTASASGSGAQTAAQSPTTSAPSVWDTVASAPVTQSPAPGQTSSASGPTAPEKDEAPQAPSWSAPPAPSPSTWRPSAPAATSKAPPAPASPAPQGPAAPAGPAYSPSGSPETLGTVGALGAGAVPGTQVGNHVPAPPSVPLPAPSVLFENVKSKLTSPFTRPGRIKTPKPSATRKPGGAIGRGRPAVNVGNRPATTLRQPVAQPAPRPAPQPHAAEVRDAQLVLTRIEPWSVFKFSFLVSLVGFVVLMVAVAALYYTFSSLGVFHAIERTVHLVTSSKGNSGTNAGSWFSAGTVLGYTMAAGAIDVILITALSTVGAVVYNAVSRLSGGVEVTLQEAD